MRDIILKRIAEIKAHENGFRRGTMKWDNFDTGTAKTHVSELNFTTLEDECLVLIFEKIVRRYYTSM